MEILSREGRRWPDPKTGPFKLWTTFAVIDGRVEIVGVEVWSVEPSSLDQTVTALTPKQASNHWTVIASERELEGQAIRSTDLRAIPLNTIASDYMKRRRLARAKEMPEFREKILQDAKRLGLVSKEFEPTPEAKTRPGRPALQFDEYLRVAEIYANATRDGLDPLKTIMNVRGHETSKSNAGKMIYRCRHTYGLLEPTTKGKRGGELTPKAIGLIAAKDSSPSRAKGKRKR